MRFNADDHFNKAREEYFDNNVNLRRAINLMGILLIPRYNSAPIQGAKKFLGVRWEIK